MKEYVLLLIGAVLVNNFVLSRFLGICPFLGVSRDIRTAFGMSCAVIFVMTSASAVTWLVFRAFLAKNSWVLKMDLEYLQTIAFILVIAAFVQLVELVLKKTSAGLHKALGIYLPLITTNCAVLGVSVLNIQKYIGSLGKTVAFGFGAAVGFSVALLIFTGLREKIARAVPPKALQGTAIALITAGLLSLAFMGFAGLVKL
ncbi:MAG: electron transport complex subunit RsxA [Kiritimatiellae bacterium]|nr:electron transport complex subunit RsxA [Kiritimatiellia bacterium]